MRVLNMASSSSVTSAVFSFSISLWMASRISAGVWPGKRNGAEDKQAGILVAGIRAEALGYGGNLLVADQAAIEARDAAVGEDVADGVVDRIVGIAVVGAVIALDVDGLRGSRMATVFSANCLGSTVVISSGLGPAGTRLKYFSSMGMASEALTSPTTATTMFAPT